MIRLPCPPHTYQESLDKCIAGIAGNEILKQKLLLSKTALVNCEVQYMQAAANGRLCDIPPIDINQADDPVIVADLKKSEFKKVYEQYFRAVGKPGREIYDRLLNSAQETCPYCGGVGIPRNLDHYLPIAHFSQFAVVPRNLIPSCRDCNMDGDNDGFAEDQQSQIIHPFLDHARFFEDQWVFGVFRKASHDQSDFIEYHANPPADWPAVDILRARNHFDDFGLPARYSIKAGQLLGTTIFQIRAMRASGVDDSGIVEMFLLPGAAAAPFINHWQRGMYQALIAALPHVL